VPATAAAPALAAAAVALAAGTALVPKRCSEPPLLPPAEVQPTSPMTVREARQMALQRLSALTAKEAEQRRADAAAPASGPDEATARAKEDPGEASPTTIRTKSRCSELEDVDSDHGLGASDSSDGEGRAVVVASDSDSDSDSDSGGESESGSSTGGGSTQSPAGDSPETAKSATVEELSPSDPTPGVSSSTSEPVLKKSGRPGHLSSGRQVSKVDSGIFINRGALRKTLNKSKSVHDNFSWCEDDALGEGAFGKVFYGRSKYLQRKVVAIKQIANKSICDLDGLYAEIQVLSDLDHPNVLRFLEAYSDETSVYIVTEVCLGGSLNHWHSRVRNNESFTRRVSHEITGALTHCHSRSVCHRDLKLDNILLLRDHIDSPVRIADFGLAKRCSKRIHTQRVKWVNARAQMLCGSPKSSSKKPCTPKSVKRTRSYSGDGMTRIKSVKGTPGYMAPEVLKLLDAQVNNKEAAEEDLYYDFRCDIWSLGCLVYALMDGDMPYTIYDVSFHVAEGAELPELREKHFVSTPGALDFVRQCLRPDFRERPQAEELLKHSWLHSDEANSTAPTPKSASDLAKRLRDFMKLSQFKRAALMAAVRHLGAYEHEELRTLFQKVDVDHTGSISEENLHRALEHSVENSEHDCRWISEVVRALDSERKGTIDFTEFMAAVMDHQIEERKDLAMAAFECFDLNGDGSISRAELEHVLEGAVAEATLRRCDVDVAGGGVGFEKFVEMLRAG